MHRARPAARPSRAADRRRRSRCASRRARPSRPRSRAPASRRSLRSGCDAYARTPAKPRMRCSAGTSGASATSGSSPVSSTSSCSPSPSGSSKRANGRGSSPPTRFCPEVERLFRADAEGDECTIPSPARPRRAGVLEERDVGAGGAALVGVEEVVDGRVVLVDRLLDHPQAQFARVELDVRGRVAGDARDVVDPFELHAHSMTHARSRDRRQADRDRGAPGSRAGRRRGPDPGARGRHQRRRPHAARGPLPAAAGRTGRHPRPRVRRRDGQRRPRDGAPPGRRPGGAGRRARVPRPPGARRRRMAAGGRIHGGVRDRPRRRLHAGRAAARRAPARERRGGRRRRGRGSAGRPGGRDGDRHRTPPPRRDPCARGRGTPSRTAPTT